MRASSGVNEQYPELDLPKRFFISKRHSGKENTRAVVFSTYLSLFGGMIWDQFPNSIPNPPLKHLKVRSIVPHYIREFRDYPESFQQL